MSYMENQLTHIEHGVIPIEEIVEPSTNQPSSLSKEQAHTTQQLNRLVNVVEAAAASFISTYTDLQKQAAEFSKKNAQEAIASSTKLSRIESKKMRYAVIGLAVSIAAAGTGVIGSGLNERTKHQRAFANDEFRRQLERLDRISAAFTEMRKVKEDALADCGSPDYDLIDVTHKRVQARFALIKETRNADYYFGADVLAAAKKFIAWEMTFPDYCKKVAPMAEWRSRQKTIEKMMRAAIKNPLDE